MKWYSRLGVCGCLRTCTHELTFIPPVGYTHWSCADCSISVTNYRPTLFNPSRVDPLIFALYGTYKTYSLQKTNSRRRDSALVTERLRRYSNFLHPLCQLFTELNWWKIATIGLTGLMVSIIIIITVAAAVAKKNNKGRPIAYSIAIILKYMYKLYMYTKVDYDTAHA